LSFSLVHIITKGAFLNKDRHVLTKSYYLDSSLYDRSISVHTSGGPKLQKSTKHIEDRIPTKLHMFPQQFRARFTLKLKLVKGGNKWPAHSDNKLLLFALGCQLLPSVLNDRLALCSWDGRHHLLNEAADQACSLVFNHLRRYNFAE